MPCIKLGFQISSTSFIHFGGFGFSTYQHPRSNEVEEFVTKWSPSQNQNQNNKIIFNKTKLKWLIKRKIIDKKHKVY